MSVIVKCGGGVSSTSPEPILPEKVDGALIFYSEAPFSMSVYNKQKNWDGILQYSLDNINWNEWNGESIEATNGIIYMRGIGNTSLNPSFTSNARFVFETYEIGCFIHCIGSMDNLLDYSSTPNLGQYAYAYMFYYCETLVTPPELPSITLSNYCYSKMFYCCYNLKEAPALPATTLAIYCYHEMFYYCYSLKTAPALPATTLADSCYYSMFRQCIALETPPEISATTLAPYCCQMMFMECHNLKEAPALPATTLADYCYNSMFESCRKLETAPTLPATTLAPYCYGNMFYSCVNLKTIPKLLAANLPNYCYNSMFSGCKNIRLSKTRTGKYQNYYRIPWSASASTVGSGALSQMFAGTGGTFTAPNANTTYYTSNDVV